jgi:hypothetical protein
VSYIIKDCSLDFNYSVNQIDLQVSHSMSDTKEGEWDKTGKWLGGVALPEELCHLKECCKKDSLFWRSSAQEASKNPQW